MKYAGTFLIPVQESHYLCFGCWGLGGSCRRERPVNQPVSVAADKVIRLHGTSTTLHQQITTHIYVSSSSLKATCDTASCTDCVCVKELQHITAVYIPGAFTHIHRVISSLNMWIAAFNGNPWLYFGPSIKADLFLFVPEPPGLLLSPSAPNVWHLHNGVSAALYGQSEKDFTHFPSRSK